ncbi:MAG: cation diffusion facilitator family transporter [Flavobacteriales bacterium]
MKLNPTRFQGLSLIVSTLIMLGKGAAWWMTDSHAIFSDAGESLINVMAGGFALFSLYLSKKPRDRGHPYGHGKIEFVSALFEALLIIGAGIGIIIKAVHGLVTAPELKQLDLGIIIAASAGALNFGLGTYAEYLGKKLDSPTLIADGKHLITDTWSSVAMVLGLGIVLLTGITWLDPAIALAMGGFIIFTGIKVLRNSIGGIMDEADEELLQEIVQALYQKKRENWVDLHNIRVIKYGPQLHVDCHLTVPWYLNVREAHQELDEVERIVNQHTERRVEFFIHTDPCIPSQCAICEKSECPVRHHPFKGKVAWDLETVRTNRKHGAEQLEDR